MFGHHRCKPDGPSILDHTDIQTLHHEVWEIFFFWSKTLQFQCFAQKNHVSTVSCPKNIYFCRENSNSLFKKKSPSERGDQDKFVDPGFCSSLYSNYEAKFVQRFGHLIRVNTWIASYPSFIIQFENNWIPKSKSYPNIKFFFFIFRHYSKKKDETGTRAKVG